MIDTFSFDSHQLTDSTSTSGQKKSHLSVNHKLDSLNEYNFDADQYNYNYIFDTSRCNYCNKMKQKGDAFYGKFCSRICVARFAQRFTFRLIIIYQLNK